MSKQLKLLKEDTVLEYDYGKYRLKVTYPQGKGIAQVSMSDVSELRFSLIWSMTMSLEQASGAIELFKQVGFFDVPIYGELNKNRIMTFYED